MGCFFFFENQKRTRGSLQLQPRPALRPCGIWYNFTSALRHEALSIKRVLKPYVRKKVGTGSADGPSHGCDSDVWCLASSCVGPLLDNRGGGIKAKRSSSGGRSFFFLLLVTSPECEEHKLMRKHSFFLGGGARKLAPFTDSHRPEYERRPVRSDPH